MIKPSTLIPAAALVAVLFVAWSALVSPLAAQQPDAPDQPLPAMPLDEVRIGMKGYGLTVFHGTRIEPFPVEVVSVISDFSPRRGTIWIRSDEPRLVVSGPVQGMSGSPIFLWEEGEEGVIGEGGRLIGAFAYGYAMVKECLAGVQPIELMRGVGERAYERQDDGQASSAGSAAMALQTLYRLQRMADDAGTGTDQRFQLDAAVQLLHAALGGKSQAVQPLSPLPSGPRDDGRVERLMLPMAVNSPRLAALTAPLLEPVGIMPVAQAGGTLGGPPPAGIDPDAVRIEPGSVLSIPLAYGDTDLSAAGTVTEVLPDGTVLGFGHAMFGQGDIALPLATGYVHFIVPRLSISFKQSGSLRLRGTITQDEAAAVAGVPEQTFDAAPMRVSVTIPGQPVEVYNYQVVNHPAMTPVLSVILALQSLTAAQELPIENTIHLTGGMTFTGDRRLAIDSIVAGGNPMALIFELLPATMLMMNNPHESLKLEAMDLDIRVEPVQRVGSIVHGRIESAEVAPGDEVRFSAVVQPYRREQRTFSGSLRLPPNLPEGDYQLMLMDGATYGMMSMANRPHRMMTTTVDDLREMLQQMLSMRPDALYAVLQLPRQGIAVGRTELPQLPSSRRALIATPTSTLAVPFAETVEEKVDTGLVIQGQLMFTVSVRHKFPLVVQGRQDQPSRSPGPSRRRP